MRLSCGSGSGVYKQRPVVDFFAFVWLAVCLPGVAAAPKSDPPVLTNLQQLRDLSAAEAAQHYPIRVLAVVNYIDPNIGELFVQDETNGAFIFVKDTTSDGPIHAGTLLDISGETTEGDFAPSIAYAILTVKGTAPLPPAKQLSFDKYDGGEHEGQRLEIVGVVQSGRVKQGRLQLNVHTYDGTLVASMVEYPPDWSKKLVRSKVRLRGVVGAIFNEHRQAIGVRLFVPGGQTDVLEPGPADPFALPLSPVQTFGQVQAHEQLPTAVRVRAAVTGVDPFGGMYINDGGASLEAQDSNLCGAVPGDIVDLVGFPGSIEGKPALQNSICRKTGIKQKVTPVDLPANQVLPPQSTEDASGYAYGVESRYDMRVVRMVGTLVQSSIGPEGGTWMLSDGATIFSATLPPEMVKGGDEIREGSQVELTGVCIVNFDQFLHGQSFRLLLRNRGDIHVLGRPPWWNLRHAAWTLGLVLISFLAAALWISILRRQVDEKTRELRRTNEALRQLSERDGLTGIANRRQFDLRLESEFRRASRSAGLVSLLMIDIDFFKLLNDEYGHQRGDDCLSQVAKTLNSLASRSEDLVARYGGEEFGVILPWTDHAGAMEVAERMRKAVEQLKIVHARSTIGQALTVSVGVATLYPEPRAKAASLLEMADKALYRSKTDGRNRVSFYGAAESASVPIEG
jgi:diguanylate cyclase (GGDEF)-like protein